MSSWPFFLLSFFWAPWMFVPGESSTQTLVYRVLDTLDDDDDDDHTISFLHHVKIFSN